MLEYSREHSTGREKAFVLSRKGREYAAPLIASLDDLESGALKQLGGEKLAMLTRLLSEYSGALHAIMDAEKE